MSQRTPRDIVWILLLLAVALTGILSLYRRIHHAQSKGEVNLCALITQRPEAIVRVLRPELLQLMLPFSQISVSKSACSSASITLR